MSIEKNIPKKSRYFLLVLIISIFFDCPSLFAMRIISLYPAHTENLFSLGLNKEIIGVSKDETYPEEALKKPVFSPFDSVEKFISARPDLILIRPMLERAHSALFSQLREAGIKIVSIQPRSIEEMYDYWMELGRLTGREKQAEEMIRKFKKEVEKIQEKVSRIPYSKRKKVFFESIHRKFKTFSPTSIAMFVLKTAGGINIAKDAITVRNTNIADYGKERILAHADEIDVYIAQRGVMNRVTKEDIIKEPGFEAIKAVREGKVYIVPEELVSRPTMRLIKGIHLIAHILYPEIFPEEE